MNRPEPMGIPELIDYHGWTIWGWTGWKGTKVIARFDKNPGCPICGLPIIAGDVLKVTQAMLFEHWNCAYPLGYEDRHMGQWLASQNGERFIEVNVDNLVISRITGGEYKRGDSFPVSECGEFITENTPEHIKALAQAAGFVRLKQLIDDVQRDDNDEALRKD